MPRQRSAWHFTLFEVFLIATFVGVAVFNITPRRYWTPPQELEPLEAKYGPARASQFGEEWIVRDFFNDKRGGYFVDVGG